MAKGKKTGGRNFQKGVSGNPKGRPPLPKELNEALRMTRKEFTELLVKYLAYSLEDLKKTQKAKETKALDRIVIAVIVNAIAKGDDRRLDFLMNRIIGKVKDVIEHETADGQIPNAVIILPDNKRSDG